MDEERRVKAETFLLTTAARLAETRGILVLVAEKDGNFTHHMSNIDGMLYAPLLGHLECKKAEIIQDFMKFVPVNPDGTPQEGTDDH